MKYFIGNWKMFGIPGSIKIITDLDLSGFKKIGFRFTCFGFRFIGFEKFGFSFKIPDLQFESKTFSKSRFKTLWKNKSIGRWI